MKIIADVYVSAFVIGCVLPVCAADGGQPDLHVKGVNILTMRVPVGPEDEVHDFELQVSLDGQTFLPLEVGLPRPWQLFQSVAYEDKIAKISVVLIGALHGSQRVFVPGSPGTYRFRWFIRLNDEHSDQIKIEQSETFRSPTRSDEGFIRKVGDPVLLQRLFGADLFEPKREGPRLLGAQEGDARAIMVIAWLLEATRARAPGEVSTPGRNLPEALIWAESLWKLSQEFPESSYAPYAAYFAGAVYSSEIVGDDRARLDDRTTDEAPARAQALSKVRAFVRSHPSYEKADNALKFAAENADAYLKPQALFIRAEHRALARDWDAADKLLDEALNAEPRGVTLNERVGKMREHMAQERQHFEH